MLGVTGDGRANFDFIDTHLFKLDNALLVEHDTGFYSNVVCTGLEHVFGNNTAKYAVTQGFDNVATFNNRRHQQAVVGTTVVFSDNQILSDIHQAASQITGVRCFQCGISKTFTRTVSRDEVLQYVQTFTEVSGNRRLDDRAIWLGHQSPHTGQLTNLRR